MKLLANFHANEEGNNKGAEMICTIEIEENKEVKVIIVENKNGDIEAKAIKGVTQEELENIIARLWTMLQPSKN